MFQRALLWLIEFLWDLYNKLYGMEPSKAIAWEIQVFPGKQGAVREKPNINYPVEWLLVENESAVVGVNPDGSLQMSLQDGTYKFYYIAFGKKRGWILFKDDRMALVSKIVEKK